MRSSTSDPGSLAGFHHWTFKVTHGPPALTVLLVASTREAQASHSPASCPTDTVCLRVFELLAHRPRPTKSDCACHKVSCQLSKGKVIHPHINLEPLYDCYHMMRSLDIATKTDDHSFGLHILQGSQCLPHTKNPGQGHIYGDSLCGVPIPQRMYHVCSEMPSIRPPETQNSPTRRPDWNRARHLPLLPPHQPHSPTPQHHVTIVGAMGICTA